MPYEALYFAKATHLCLACFDGELDTCDSPKETSSHGDDVDLIGSWSPSRCAPRGKTIYIARTVGPFLRAKWTQLLVDRFTTGVEGRKSRQVLYVKLGHPNADGVEVS